MTLDFILTVPPQTGNRQSPGDISLANYTLLRDAMPLAASSGTERSAQVSAFFTLPEELRHAVFRASERGDVRSMGGGALLLTDAQRVLRLVCRVGHPSTLDLEHRLTRLTGHLPNGWCSPNAYS